MEFTLLFAAATGAGLVWLANRLLAHRRPEWLQRPTDLIIGAAAAGMVAGRLAAMTQAGVNPITHPLDVLLVRAGVDTAFASVGALVALGWASRSRLPEIYDVLASPALAGLAGWHAGCLWRGTCLGAVTDLPWGMAIATGGVPRHPVELYAAAGLVAGAVLVARLPRIPWVPGGAALAVAASVRLVTEPLRLSVMGGQVGLYLGGTAIGLAVAAAGWWRHRHRSPVTA